MSRPLIENDVRFWSKVEKTEACWIWNGHAGVDGLGRFSVSYRTDQGTLLYRTVMCARYAFEQIKKRQPSTRLSYVCENRRCVRIDDDHVRELVSLCHPDRPRGSNGICNACYLKQRRLDNPVRYMINHLRGQAKVKGVHFDLDESDLLAVWVDTCPVFGMKLQFNRNRADDSISVDRRDNTKGYIRGNVMVMSWKANRLKSDATIEDLDRLVRFMRSEEVDPLS